MPAHIVTAALFAPATTRTHLASAGDPIFSNEEHYPHLSPFPYTSTRSSAGGGGGGSEADSGGRKGKGKAEDMIIVVADGMPLNFSFIPSHFRRMTDKRVLSVHS